MTALSRALAGYKAQPMAYAILNGKPTLIESIGYEVRENLSGAPPGLKRKAPASLAGETRAETKSWLANGKCDSTGDGASSQLVPAMLALHLGSDWLSGWAAGRASQ